MERKFDDWGRKRMDENCRNGMIISRLDTSVIGSLKANEIHSLLALELCDVLEGTVLKQWRRLLAKSEQEDAMQRLSNVRWLLHSLFDFNNCSSATSFHKRSAITLHCAKHRSMVRWRSQSRALHAYQRYCRTEVRHWMC